MPLLDKSFRVHMAYFPAKSTHSKYRKRSLNQERSGLFPPSLVEFPFPMLFTIPACFKLSSVFTIVVMLRLLSLEISPAVHTPCLFTIDRMYLKLWCLMFFGFLPFAFVITRMSRLYRFIIHPAPPASQMYQTKFVLLRIRLTHCSRE